MKYGASGIFRYRVADGNTPCDGNVFGKFPQPEMQDNENIKCYKYTPNVSRRRNTGIFKDVAPKGIKAEFYANMDAMVSVGGAAAKAGEMEPTKSLFIKDIMYPETTGIWEGLDANYVQHFFARFSGVLMIKEDGKYTFFLTADDGANLFIDRDLVQCSGNSCSCNKAGCLALQNDGPKTDDCATLETETARETCMAKLEVSGEAELVKGIPRIEIDYFVNEGPHWLQVEWSGDDFSRRPLTEEFIGQYEKFVEEGGNWAEAAKDGEEFKLDATTEVRYGKLDYWVYKVFKAGDVPCKADVFGDPVHDKAKSCWKRLDSQGTRWYPCALEGQVCKGFPTNHKIRYGSEGKYTFMETAGDTPCNSDEFGDPNPGFQKQCFVLMVPEKKKVSEEAYTRPPEPYNLAFNRTTTKQISTSAWAKGTSGEVAFDGAPGRAVDGVTDGNYGAGSCTHTFAQNKPWWRVELKEPSKVMVVKIFARTDPVENCAHPHTAEGSCALTDIQVYVGNAPFSYGDAPCLEDPINIDKEATVSCNDKVGKFVFVERQGEGSLSLCEVEVIGLSVSEAGGNVEDTPPVEEPPDLFTVEMQDGWKAEGPLPKATVERECPSCSSNLCLLHGLLKQPKGISPSEISVLGTAPAMCKPHKKHTFLVANAVTGTAEVTVNPNGELTVSKIINQVSWEEPLISLDGIYYYTNPSRDERNSITAEKAKANAATGYDGFRFKELGPYCILWGRVGGDAGSAVGQVPSTCRPTQKLIFSVAASVPQAWISIDTAGTVRVENSGPVSPTYEKPEGWDVTGGPPAELGPAAWINPLAAVAGNESNSSNITCDDNGVCSGGVGNFTPPEPPLTKKTGNHNGTCQEAGTQEHHKQ